MAELRIRKRHRLRKKEIEALANEISSQLGIETFTSEDTVDRAESSDYDVIFVNGEIEAIVFEGKVFLTLRGLLKYKPQRMFVTVDMGAVPFISNGADVMCPGIVEADPDIREGDLVWVRDVRNKVPIAIGKALISAGEMLKKKPGKAIKTIHFVGDRLWKFSEE
ncbi:MAG: RNA-binding protein [Methanomassiliicoccales archaeon]|jgi:PUA domain protein|nr:RNA-binding protein [Methanomassiliicoccales archaeon]